jgi:lipopolysaccharide/colanic/teichoic acid biosynthesis glycosyltransferase
MLKRLFDLAAAVVLLLCALPILSVICLALFIDMRGSIFCRQLRVGRGGRLFHVIFFRTRRIASSGSTAQKSMPRTPFGNFLHHFRINELPHLLNVMAGDMSIVGPRARVPEMV